MKIIVISSYTAIREGIVSIISRQDNISIQLVCETIREAIFMMKGNMIDLVLLDIHKDNEEELNLIKEIMASEIKVKFILLDFYGNSQLFVKALKCGIQGYILGKSNEEEMLYAIDQVYKGKKYFDSYFVDCMVNKKNYSPNRLELLTIREREMLIEVAKGSNNREISERLLITENTVKKHINHIFSKLNISDRTEAALYVNKCESLNIYEPLNK